LGLSTPVTFFNHSRKKFDLVTSTNEQVNTIIPTNTCGHQFKATDGWNRPETIAPSKTALDKSGVVGITCFHPVNLRFLNIYDCGEWLSHGFRLREARFHEVSHFSKLKFCYDMSCVLKCTLYHHNLAWMEVVEAQMGGFMYMGMSTDAMSCPTFIT
jgi:hypothetical protein